MLRPDIPIIPDIPKKAICVLAMAVIGASFLTGAPALAYFPHSFDYDDPIINWNQFTKLMIRNDMLFFFGHTYPPTNTKHVYAVTHVAIHNALLEARDGGDVPEDAVVSGAAREALSTLFPQHENRITLFHNKQISKISGFDHSKVAEGVAIGKESTKKFLATVQIPDHNKPFGGTIPEGPCMWTGTNPVTPDAGGWQTFFIADVGDYLAAPPHRCNSPEDLAEVAEVEAVSKTRSAADADLGRYYGEDVGFALNDAMTALALVQRSEVRDSAYAFAYANAAMYDSGIAIWNSKYTYWTERPEKRIPGLDQTIPSPNFPAYPSGHSGIAATGAAVLTEIYPEHGEYLTRLYQDISKSRLDVGVHYRQDNEEGVRVGLAIGEAVIRQMDRDLPIAFVQWDRG